MAKWGIQGETGSLGQIQVGHNDATMTQIMTSSASGVELKNINSFTASYAKITELDVYTINSIAATETTLEIADKLIIAASGASDANSSGGGLQIGGTNGSDTVASMLYDDSLNSNAGGFDFNLDGSTVVSVHGAGFVPTSDNAMDLGATGAEFKDLYLDGTANIDTLSADALGSALNCGNYAMTNVNIDSGVAIVTSVSCTSLTGSSVDLNGGSIDGTVIGGSSAAAGTFTNIAGTLTTATQNSVTTMTGLATVGTVGTGVWQGTAVADAYVANNLTLSGSTINNSIIGAGQAAAGTFTALTATGTSTLSTVDIGAGAIDGTTIGAASAAAGTFTTVGATSVSASSFVSASSLTIGEDSATIDYSTSLDLSLGSTKYAALSTSHFSASVELQGPSLEVSGAAQVGSLASSGAITGTTVSGSGAANFTTLRSDSVDLNGGSIDGTVIGAASAAAGTFTTVSAGTSLALASGATVTGIDNGALGSSATLLATQGAIKTYVDAQVTAQDLDFQGDSGGALMIDLDSETLDIAGGTNITTAGSGNTLTVNLDAALSGLTSVAATSVSCTSLTGSSVDLNGGAIDGTVIGASSAAAGTFTNIAGTLTTATQNSVTTMTGLTTVGTVGTGVWQGTAIADAYVANVLTLSGSTINNSIIGAGQAAAGTFTTLASTGASTLASLVCTAGATFGGGYGATGVTITTAGVLQADGAVDFGSTLAAGGNITLANGVDLVAGGAECDIGSSGQSFAAVYASNVYTGDMHLKNERGDWTIFEESDHLRIRNNATGQTFKMAMTPIEE